MMRQEDVERKPQSGAPDISRKVELDDLEERKRRMVEFGRHVGDDMVVVEAGEFLMGSTGAEGDRISAMDSNMMSKWMSDEKPQHRVYLDAYAIGIHPVTVAQYRTFCGAIGRAMPSPPNWGWLDDHPVVNVTWHDATAYCEWAGNRLPTEAEWEKAARGTNGRIFPWGNDWNTRAAHCQYQHKCEWTGKTAPVGSLPEGVSPCGCHDMVGNVWEWCADWYEEDYYYRESPGTLGVPWHNPKGPGTGAARVLRGGSWGEYHLRGLRGANRYRGDPDDANATRGFRCAQDLGWVSGEWSVMDKRSEGSEA